jgi:hypothetical protein
MNKTLIVFVGVALALTTSPVRAQRPANGPLNVKDTVELELLTHTEVAEKIHNGMTSILLVTGGTEERGPHDVLGGHNDHGARQRAVEIARRLGNALVAPVFPVTPAATGLRENTEQPGAISIPADVVQGGPDRRDRKHGDERLQRTSF